MTMKMNKKSFRYNINSFDCNGMNTITYIGWTAKHHISSVYPMLVACSLPPCLFLSISCREYNFVLKNWFMCLMHWKNCVFECIYVTHQRKLKKKETRANAKIGRTLSVSVCVCASHNTIRNTSILYKLLLLVLVFPTWFFSFNFWKSSAIETYDDVKLEKNTTPWIQRWYAARE